MMGVRYINNIGPRRHFVNKEGSHLLFAFYEVKCTQQGLGYRA